MMYSEINIALRTLVDDADFIYQSSLMKKLYRGEWDTDEGPHIRVLTHTNEPTAEEIGFSAPENVTGYIQIGAFVPATDKGLDYSMNDLASQIHTQFQRQSFVTGNLKVEILNVSRGDIARINGHESITCLVNFRIFHCQ